MALPLKWNAIAASMTKTGISISTNGRRCVWVFSRRLPMMHRDGWAGQTASSQMNTAWFVWDRTGGGTRKRPYGDMTEVRRINWKARLELPVLKPEGVE
ncbi:hypothetical protein [Nitratireductor sp. XY-223]|uniref:hypothetical protein n=1 Tax=Nitratireductor sp. XY-223 TaxID=2561926 RepID=UPI0019807822